MTASDMAAGLALVRAVQKQKEDQKVQSRVRLHLEREGAEAGCGHPGATSCAVALTLLGVVALAYLQAPMCAASPLMLVVSRATAGASLTNGAVTTQHPVTLPSRLTPVMPLPSTQHVTI